MCSLTPSTSESGVGAHIHSGGRLAPLDLRDLLHQERGQAGGPQGRPPWVILTASWRAKAGIRAPLPSARPNRSTPTCWRRFCASCRPPDGDVIQRPGRAGPRLGSSPGGSEPASVCRSARSVLGRRQTVLPTGRESEPANLGRTVASRPVRQPDASLKALACHPKRSARWCGRRRLLLALSGRVD
jgi:hypothetical protein